MESEQGKAERILVVGAGATGGFFGGRLAEAGRDVTFLVRPRRAATLRERGLRIIGLGERTLIEPRLITAGEISHAYDVVLLSVKGTGLAQAIEDLAPAVGRGTSIVPFLNGMAHLDALNARFGADAVLGGVVKVATIVDAAGDIVRLAPMADLVIGEQYGRPTPRVQEVCGLLSAEGIDTAVTADIVTAMWHKWVFIVTVGALTCLARGSVGEIADVPGGTDLGPAILAEAAAVSAAAGHPLPADQLAWITETVTQRGSGFTSSMYRDVVAGLPTEVEHVFGDLVGRARTLSVDTPLLDLATVQLRVHQHRTATAP
ncbi:2-dehydropantoate 2-reductase [Microtetraspora sp. NBRC 13810]|uniref:ketopantoate reductase family protein n=1 Tax=Microtetraspora sp. NBRC 13810 TaxID=3030990 RepID=UPI0024A4FFA5|nr:2-dehydropantoate 2-reductase [Microtetraspora sp. NBRC 13810]GLW11379.1 2-dehydropantoate 2-reductase [Microtetraspora sp. NBRC 13810]